MPSHTDKDGKEMKPTEKMERTLTWHNGRPIYAHRWRKSSGERGISIVVHHPKNCGTQEITFDAATYGDEYEDAAKHALELLDAAANETCKLPEPA